MAEDWKVDVGAVERAVEEKEDESAQGVAGRLSDMGRGAIIGPSQ